MVAHPETPQDRRYVTLDGVRRRRQQACDLVIALAIAEQRENLALAIGQRIHGRDASVMSVGAGHGPTVPTLRGQRQRRHCACDGALDDFADVRERADLRNVDTQRLIDAARKEIGDVEVKQQSARGRGRHAHD
jgi:hypothetical protein